MKKPESPDSLKRLEDKFDVLERQLVVLTQNLKNTHGNYISRTEFASFFKFSITILIIGIITSGFVSMVIMATMTVLRSG